MTLPAPDLRSNVGTWAVTNCQLPAVTRFMLENYKPEEYDQDFQGQQLVTTYFDTRDFDLRKARLKKKKYLTLRIRNYNKGQAFALSAKTEDQKYRREIDSLQAEEILAGRDFIQSLLPGNLIARLDSLTNERQLVPVVQILSRRFAVQDNADRFTLDVDVRTNTGKVLPHHVLEMKSTEGQGAIPFDLDELNLAPTKLSKFLWSTFNP